LKTLPLFNLICLISTLGLSGPAFAAPTPSMAHLHSRPPWALRLPLAGSQAPTGRQLLPSSTARGADEADDDDADMMSFLGQHRLDRPRFRTESVESDTAVIMTYFRGVTGAHNLELAPLSRSGHDGVTLYGFAQAVNKVPIVGTFALAKVHHDMVQYARHFLVQPPKIDTRPRIDAAAAGRDAWRDILSFAKQATPVTSPILGILYDGEQPRLVYRVGIDSEGPWNYWTVSVDAHDGQIVRRERSGLDGVQGVVTGSVEPACEGDPLEAMPLPFVQWSHGLATDAAGAFSSDAELARAELSLNGAYFRVEPFVGEPLQQQTNLRAAPAHNEVRLSDAGLSQLDAYYHASRARLWLGQRAAGVPSLAQSRLWPWANSQVVLRVDLPSGYKGFSCNAFYDGRSLNFYQADATMGCHNSSRVAKVVYHEYGHGVHDHLTANEHTFDPQVSEGVADYIMAAITDDPNVTGLFGRDVILEGRSTARTCVNNYTYCRSRRCDSFPGDEPHNAAPVLCGALWELRAALEQRYPGPRGQEVADQFVLRFLTLVTDMNSAYSAAIAADDDDDHNPANGTRHSCEINDAFLGLPGKLPHFPNLRRQRVPCVPQVAAPVDPSAPPDSTGA
jgi:hypothetical protein